MNEDKRARLKEINYDSLEDWGWLISELEAAWAEVERLKSPMFVVRSDEAAYQRRHRKWALKQLHTLFGAYSFVSDSFYEAWKRLQLCAARAEAAEAKSREAWEAWDRAEERAQAAEKELADYKDECTRTHEADNERCKAAEAQLDRLSAFVEELAGADCARSNHHSDDCPCVSCRARAVLEASARKEEEKP